MSEPSASEPPASSSQGFDQAFSRFQEGTQAYQAQLVQLVEEAKKASERLAQEREALELDKAAFAQERQRIAGLTQQTAQQVTLNIGGRRFTTTQVTLCNAPEPSLFAAMFSGRHPLQPDETGCFFIDRDPTHFTTVLNFLRDGCLALPAETSDFKYLLELRAEADFYGLTKMTEQIDAFQWSVTTVPRALQLRAETTWVYESEPDQIVFSVDKPVQLLGVGLCATDTLYTVRLAVLEVSPTDYAVVLSTLGEVEQTVMAPQTDVAKVWLPAAYSLAPGKRFMISAVIHTSDESYCCEECVEACTVGGVRFTFYAHESSNGTSEERGQFPLLLVRVGQHLFGGSTSP